MHQAWGTLEDGCWVQMGCLPFSNSFLPTASPGLPRAPSRKLGVWHRGRGQPSRLVLRNPPGGPRQSVGLCPSQPAGPCPLRPSILGRPGGQHGAPLTVHSPGLAAGVRSPRAAVVGWGHGVSARVCVLAVCVSLCA